MIINFVLWLLVGISVFLFGLNIMGDGLEKLASKNMRNILSRVSDNRGVGVFTGATITALIHSSAAMTVMVIGFVNANIMSLTQAASLIFGANIGTTVTGLLVAFGSYDIKVYLALPVAIGIIINFITKKPAIKKIGTILIGVGLIFIGLNIMSDAVSPVGKTAEFRAIFETISNPILLMLIGIVVTALVQSSTAVNSIILVLAAEGAMPIMTALYIILGTNVGTCITALLASVGVTTNAKRASMIHLLFNVFGTIIFAAVFVIIDAIDATALPNFIGKVFGNNAMFQIAWFNFFQNIICTLLLLPLLKPFVKLTMKLVKDKEPKKQESGLVYIDEKFLSSPAIALTQALQEVLTMAQLAKTNLKMSLDALLSNNLFNIDAHNQNEAKINNMNLGVTDFLVKLTGVNLTVGDEKLVGSLFAVVSDIERIGDHSENLMEFAQKNISDMIVFSDVAKEELSHMGGKVLEFFDLSVKVFKTRDSQLLSSVMEREDEIDKLTADYNANHITRMTEGLCSPKGGIVFYGAITNLERIADHLTTIAYSINSDLRVRTQVIAEP